MSHEENYTAIIAATKEAQERYEGMLAAINKLHGEKSITDIQRLDLLIASTRILEPVKTILDTALAGRQSDENARFAAFFGGREEQA